MIAGFELMSFLSAAVVVFAFISAILYLARPDKKPPGPIWSPPVISVFQGSITSTWRAKAEMDGKTYYLSVDGRWYEKNSGMPTSYALRQTLWSWYNATLTHKASLDLKESMRDLP